MPSVTDNGRQFFSSRGHPVSLREASAIGISRTIITCRVRSLLSIRLLVCALLLGLLCVTAPAQIAPGVAANAASAPAIPRNGHLLLVMPFENRTSQPNLEWIGESVSEVLNQRLASAGFLPI